MTEILIGMVLAMMFCGLYTFVLPMIDAKSKR